MPSLFTLVSFWAHFNRIFLWISFTLSRSISFVVRACACVCLRWSMPSYDNTIRCGVYTFGDNHLCWRNRGKCLSDQLFQLVVYQVKRDTMTDTVSDCLYPLIVHGSWWFNLLLNTSFSLNCHPFVNEKFPNKSKGINRPFFFRVIFNRIFCPWVRSTKSFQIWKSIIKSFDLLIT